MGSPPEAPSLRVTGSMAIPDMQQAGPCVCVLFEGLRQMWICVLTQPVLSRPVTQLTALAVGAVVEALSSSLVLCPTGRGGRWPSSPRSQSSQYGVGSVCVRGFGWPRLEDKVRGLDERPVS